MRIGRGGAVACVAAMSFAGCMPRAGGTLPSAEAVVASYQYDGELEAEIMGNVAVLTVSQSAQQLRRGGKLWAKVGPYIFLFSAETRQLFEDYTALAGVRVITKVGNAEVANALLSQSELSDILWRRALNISGQARRDGTQRMTLLEDLVDWGEAHTEYTYNERYTRR
jgi:hypothetical protein